MTRSGATGDSHRLAFPVEVTTENGTLATIEAISVADEARFFSGALWPLCERNVAMTWRRNGQPTDGAPGAGFDPATSDVKEFVANPSCGRT